MCAWMAAPAQVGFDSLWVVPKQGDYLYTAMMGEKLDTLPVIFLVADTSAAEPGHYGRNQFNTPGNMCFWVRGAVIRGRWSGARKLIGPDGAPLNPDWVVWMWRPE